MRLLQKMAYLFQWNWSANGAKKSERNFGSGYGPGFLACCIQANGKCQMLGTVQGDWIYQSF